MCYTGNCRGNKVGIQQSAKVYAAAVEYDSSQPKLNAYAQARFLIRTLHLERIVEAGNGVKVYQEEYDELIRIGAPIQLIG